MKKSLLSLICATVALSLSLSSCAFVPLRSADEVPSYPIEKTVETVLTPSVPYSPEGYITKAAKQADVDGRMMTLNTVAEPPDPYKDVKVSLVAAGDNLIHPNIYIDAYNRGSADKRYDFLPVYSDVADMIASADIAFINQETVMAGASYGYSGWPTFNAPQELGKDLAALGFDVVNIANNHMLDMGTQGLLDTIGFWHGEPVTMIGGYTDADDYNELRITESGGIKTAWLSYTYGTNEIEKASWSDAVIPYIDDETILADISRAKGAADFVVVSIHWGEENTQTPTAEQRRLAQLIADGGADLILGHHSHAVQPIEWVHTDRKDVLCVYSLGNFISGMARPVNVVGGLLSLDIVGDGIGGLTVDNILFTPTVFWYGMDWFGTHLYLMDDFNDLLASSHGVRIEGYRITAKSAREIVTDVIDAEYLPEYLR